MKSLLPAPWHTGLGTWEPISTLISMRLAFSACCLLDVPWWQDLLPHQSRRSRRQRGGGDTEGEGPGSTGAVGLVHGQGCGALGQQHCSGGGAGGQR